MQAGVSRWKQLGWELVENRLNFTKFSEVITSTFYWR